MVVRILNRARSSLPLLLGALCACVSGVKYVGEGEPCGKSSSEIEGDVLCRQGLICFPDQLPINGIISGHCRPPCQSNAMCARSDPSAPDACALPGSDPPFTGLLINPDLCCTFDADAIELRACVSAYNCGLLMGLAR